MQPRQRPSHFNIIVAMATLILGIGLLKDAPAVVQGIRDGLETCGGVLIPALFPFMALCCFLSCAPQIGALLSRPLSPITTRLYKLPADMGLLVLLSLVGGYPVGAKMIASLLEQKRISPKDAERMLCFCFNAGPSFVITAVGAGMLANRRIGIILLISQIAATLLLGALISRKAKIPVSAANLQGNKGLAASFVEGVTAAASAMMGMCAFAVLFSGILSLIRQSALFKVVPVSRAGADAIVSGLLEVTSGCISAASVGGVVGLALVSAIISFGGLSVLFQVMFFFQGLAVSFKKFLIFRLAHMVVSTGICLALYQMLYSVQAVMVTEYNIKMQANENTMLISVCLISMCTILLLSQKERVSPSGTCRKKQAKVK